VRPLAAAAEGKGTLNLVHRAGVIGARYGVGPRRMERRLASVLEIVQRYGCGATLPVTATAVERHPSAIARYAALGIEFAAHGYTHVDHAGLSVVDQIEQLGRARRVLEANGIPIAGFRAPYLRWSDATLHALRENGFLYDSSQAMNWPIDPELETDAYRRGLAFCAAVPATKYPVLPRSEDGIVRIPCCLPDDEAIVDRLRLSSPEAIGEFWLRIQRETYELGELFTLALHPERIEPCASALETVLETARAARPSVWIARLAEIARWWSDRASAAVTVRDHDPGRLRVSLQGPRGLTLLARGLEIRAPEPWADGYVRVDAHDLDLRVERRPFVGVHPSAPRSLTSFLREQGYIVEVSRSPDRYTCYLAREGFSREDERPLLTELEGGRFPLLRLGRWPDGARSALSVTGDVDALTVWDYALRFLGR